MGIVAFCPQGHRVKVKVELAGRKGICPECGARFRIPLESASAPHGSPEVARAVAADGPPAPLVAAAAAPAATSASGTPVARIVSLDSALAATLPRAIPLAIPEGG
ncbi:MAG: hypothetical protein ACKO1M_15820 [Planctomycetota bacterium]